MSPKALKYVLLLATAVVWGIIVYRIIHSLNDQPAPPVQNAISKPRMEKDSIENISYSLLPPYPDRSRSTAGAGW